MINKALHMLADRHFILYAVIGISGVILDFAIYLLLVGIGIPAIVASFISVSIAIINNFFLNRHYNFKKKDHTLRRFASFYLVGLTGVILSIFFIYIGNTIFGADAIITKIISIPFIVVFQYWFNKNASFAPDAHVLPWKEIALFSITIGTLALFAFNGPYHSFTDEDDNLLGAQFIVQGGGVIYKDYFSHHMPLTYFAIAPLFALLGTHLIAIKVAFGLLMGTWLLVMARHILKKFGLLTYTLLVFTIALSQTLTWSNMVLAETFISFAILHTLILFITRKERRGFADIYMLLILGAVPVLSALSYAPLSIFMYLIALFIAYERTQKSSSFPTKSLIFAILVGSLPYLALLGYLLFTHSFTEMKQQALTFNTLYYSQFTTSAVKTPVDAIASILQGTFQSYKDSLSFQGGAHPQPLSFLFSAALTIAVTLFFLLKKRVLAVVFLIAILLSASRFGFASTFSNDGQARSGMILAFIGILGLTLAIAYLRKAREREIKYKNILLAAISVSIGYILVSSISLMSTIARDYTTGNSLVQVKTTPESPSVVVNQVNKPEDYYWIGPLDFGSQLFIQSHNASEYRFYAPWHSACGECTDEIIKDINEKRPNVILLNTSFNIWGYSVAKYSERLRASYEHDYYRVSDPRLQHYLFLKEHKPYIDQRLDRAGYEL